MKKLEVVVNKQALLFDLDGTLIDSLDDLVCAINLTLERNRLPTLSREAVSRMIGKGTRILVEKALFESLGHVPTPESLERIHLEYRQNMIATQGRFTRCFEGVPLALEQLKNTGFKLALVTNKPRVNTLYLLEQLRLLPLFDEIVAGDDVLNPKPAPEMLFRAMQSLNVSADECFMVGDSLNDAQAAKRAQVACILVETGYNEGINIKEWAKIHTPESLVFANIKDIVSFLSQ